MLTYTAHRKADPLIPDHTIDHQGIVFIKDGFAWLALILPFFWMLWHRLWLPLAGYLAAVTLIAVAGYLLSLPDGLTGTIGLLANLFVGLEGNNFRRRALRKRGYEEIADIVADNGEEASYRYFAAQISNQNG